MKFWLKNTLRQAAWAPATVFILYLIAKKVFNHTIIDPWLDILAHVLGGFAITYFYFIGFAHFHALHGLIPRLTHLALPVGLTAITAIVWEILEYVSDSIFSTKLAPSLSDSLSDQFCGLLGAFIFASLAARSRGFFQLPTRDIGERG